MIVAHLSDLHLGFEAFAAMDRGRNARYRDVERAYQRAIHDVVALRPDLVLIAGDLVDNPNPSADTLLTLTHGLGVLREGLPDVPVILTSGERDTPIRGRNRGILPVLDTLPGVEAVSGAPRAIHLKELDTHVLVLPHRAVHSGIFPAIRPRASAGRNLLMLHGRVQEGRGPALDLAGWDYVALGHRHAAMQVGPRAWYSGALERVKADPWSESADEKGFLTVDIESGETEFHPVLGRPVVELAPVLLRPGEERELNRKVADAVEVVPGGIDGKLVRLRIMGLGPGASTGLDAELMGRLRERALHLRVEVDGRGEEGLPIRLAEGVDLEARIETAAAGEEDGRKVLRTLGGLLDEIQTLADGVVHDPPHPRTDGAGVFGQIEPMAFNRRGAPQPAPPPVLFREAAAVLARAAGADRLEILRRLLTTGTLDPTEQGGRALLGEYRALRNRILAVEAAVQSLRAMERELQELRADGVEVAGDLEAATADWLRERQDAETNLLTYRDQARELKARLRQVEAGGVDAACPTCDRPLGESVEEVAAELREEWESLVQDGKWWKGRREQLEEKPPAIREQESRERQIQAAMDSVSQRIHAARAGQLDLDDLRERAHSLEDRLEALGLSPDSELGAAEGEIAVPTGFEPGTPEASLAVSVVRRAEDSVISDAQEELVRRASRVLNRLSCGQVSEVMGQGEELQVLWDGQVRPTPPEWTEFLSGLAVRIALVDALGDGSRVAAVTIDHRLDLLPPELRVLVLREAKRLAREGVRVRIRTHGAVVSHHPEWFDAVAEGRPDSGDEVHLPVGEALLHLATSDGGGSRRVRSERVGKGARR